MKRTNEISERPPELPRRTENTLATVQVPNHCCFSFVAPRRTLGLASVAPGGVRSTPRRQDTKQDICKTKLLGFAKLGDKISTGILGGDESRKRRIPRPSPLGAEGRAQYRGRGATSSQLPAIPRRKRCIPRANELLAGVPLVAAHAGAQIVAHLRRVRTAASRGDIPEIARISEIAVNGCEFAVG